MQFCAVLSWMAWREGAGSVRWVAMTCRKCGRYAPPDRETGYDGDDLCPDCSILVESRCQMPAELWQEPVDAEFPHRDITLGGEWVDDAIGEPPMPEPSTATIDPNRLLLVDRALIVQADNLLSLVRHRYRHASPDDVCRDMETCYAALRACYEPGKPRLS
jgi:hypothetical protein